MESPEVIRIIELLKESLSINLNIEREIEYGHSYNIVTATLSFGETKISEASITIDIP